MKSQTKRDEYVAELEAEIAERVRAQEQAGRERAVLILLNSLNHAANRGASLEEIFDLLGAESKKAFSSQGATVYLLSPDKDALLMQNLPISPDIVRRIEKLIGREIPRVRIPLQAGSIYNDVLRSGETQLVHDPAAIQRMMAEFTESEQLKKLISPIGKLLDIGSVAIVPLLSDGELIGLMSMANREPFTGLDLERFEAISGQIAAIIRRRQADEALRESERRYRLLAENVTDVIWTLDLEGNFTYVSPSVERLRGYTAQEVMQEPMSAALTPDSLQIVAARLSALQQASAQDDLITAPTRFELEQPCKDGSTVWTEVIVSSMLDEGGALAGILGVTRDLAERVRANQERRQLLAQISEQVRQLQQVMDAVPDGVLLLDNDGKVVMANPGAERSLAVLARASVGDTLTQLAGRQVAELLVPPPAGELWHEIKASGRTYEIVAVPSAGQAVEADTQGGATGWVLAIRDATQEREMQERARQQERLAAVGQLAAGIAHDFNNIMAVIVLYAQMSQRTPNLSPKLQERLEIIDQQARRASDLTNQILDFGRRSVLEQKPLNLATLVGEQVKLLERTLPENIDIQFACGPDEYTIKADLTRMQQVFMNLAVNARDAMPLQSGMELRISLARLPAGEMVHCVTCGQVMTGRDGWVQLTVADSGVGIPDDVLPRIFDPFYTTKEVGAGTGLGLAQVYGIIKQHDGHINVETRLGEGTTFTIFMPALSLSGRLGSPDLPPLELAQGQGETVLVVEDNPAVRKSLVASLEAINYRVLEAANGREALEILGYAARRVDLVLSDLVMPGMGGQALFRALREQDQEIKVVLITGHPLQDELVELEAQGLNGWLLKPVRLEQLAQLLMQVLPRI